MIWILYHHPITLLLVNSSVFRTGIQCWSLPLRTAFCHVARADANQFPVCVWSARIFLCKHLYSRQKVLPHFLQIRSFHCYWCECQLPRMYECVNRWLAVPPQCGTFLMYAGVLRELSVSALSCCLRLFLSEFTADVHHFCLFLSLSSLQIHSSSGLNEWDFPDLIGMWLSWSMYR